MTIIVAFILEAFVFRMNYNRKNQDSEGLCKPLGRERVRPAACPAGRLSSRQLLGCLAAQLSGCATFWQLSYLSGLSASLSHCHCFSNI